MIGDRAKRKGSRSPITRGGTFSVGTLLALEQPNKKDPRRDSQNVEYIADSAAHRHNDTKTDGNIVAHIKPTTAISEALAICSRLF